MEIPEKETIKINEFKVDRINMSQKNLDLSFNYSAGTQKGKVSRKLQFSEDVINTVLAVVNEIKHGKPLMKFENEGDMKERLVHHLKRLLQEVKDLEKFKEQERYMKAYNRINCYKITFPEITI